MALPNKKVTKGASPGNSATKVTTVEVTKKSSGTVPSSSRVVQVSSMTSRPQTNLQSGGSERSAAPTGTIPKTVKITSRSSMDMSGRKKTVTAVMEKVSPKSSTVSGIRKSLDRESRTPSISNYSKDRLTVRPFQSPQQCPASASRYSTSSQKFNSGKRSNPCTNKSGSKTSLEDSVEKELLCKSNLSHGKPLRARGSEKKVVKPPVIETEKGPVQATHKISIKQTINNTSENQHISKVATGIIVDKGGRAEQIELNLQQVKPSSANAVKRSSHMSPISEVLSTTNSITIAPGIKATVDTTVYETTSPAAGTSKSGLQQEDIVKMIKSENQESLRVKYMTPPELLGASPSDFVLKKKLQKLNLTRDSVRRLETLMVNPPPRPDELQEELAPEIMAAIMHTEELGLTMGSQPENIYNYLFPEMRGDFSMRISSVAPSPLEKVVVPVNIPQNLHADAFSPELTAAIESTLPPDEPYPSDDIYLQSIIQKGGSLPKPHNIAIKKDTKKKKEEPLLQDEQPPWDDDLNPIMNVVGVSPSNVMTTVSETELETLFQIDHDTNVEYQIIPEPPRHISKVQLRGSQKPPWFPGIKSDTIKLARSPSEVFSAAYQAVQPNAFPDESFVVIGT